MVASPTSAKVQILVIGGGPAGSYAATALAREGFQVTLLEATKFPRYHIGESLLPSVRPFLKFIGAEDAIKSYGFTVKPGAAIKLNQYKREGYTDFVTLDPNNGEHKTNAPPNSQTASDSATDSGAGKSKVQTFWNNGSWNVIRAEFDHVLLRHAAKSGATVIQETKVTELHFIGERPVSATWVSRHGTKGQIAFDYLVDASGKNGIISTKYLNNRHFNKSLDNIACWGYWEGTGCYKPGTPRENAIWVEALPDESGWAWFIPLHDGSTSVGVVMDQDASTRKKKEARNVSRESDLQAHYLQEVHKVPGLMKLLENATLRNSGQPGAVKSTSDFSYSASSYAGDHYRIAGDAGAFVDPFFSSGVHLAFTGGLSAALTISASIRGLATEADAQRWHTSKVGTAYTRFLLVVLGTYKQIRNQAVPVMSDVDEDNYDRAFNMIRPVIQGTADIGKAVSEDELQKTMDFCRHLFAPTDPEMHRAVSTRVDPALINPDGPIMTEAEINTLLDIADEEARHVLHEINARKQVHTMYSPVENFGTEDHFGLKAVLQRGRLGLTVAARERDVVTNMRPDPIRGHGQQGNIC